MRCLIQRVSSSKVMVNKQEINAIKLGLTILVGFTHTDTSKEIDYCVNKIVNLRIFDDEQKIMNKSIIDVQGQILAISQFTLYGDPLKGHRPSYIKAANKELAFPLYEEFCQKLNQIIPTKKGVFGADMQLEIINDGPCTIFIDTDYK